MIRHKIVPLYQQIIAMTKTFSKKTYKAGGQTRSEGSK